MRTESELRAELARLEAVLNDPVRRFRMPRYGVASYGARIESLKWALGQESIFDDEQR